MTIAVSGNKSGSSGTGGREDNALKLTSVLTNDHLGCKEIGNGDWDDDRAWLLSRFP